MTTYLKTVVAALGVLAMAVTAALSDKAVSLDEANGVLLAFEGLITSLGVWAVPK